MRAVIAAFQIFGWWRGKAVKAQGQWWLVKKKQHEGITLELLSREGVQAGGAR
jgi:hypothetical protein